MKKLVLLLISLNFIFAEDIQIAICNKTSEIIKIKEEKYYKEFYEIIKNNYQKFYQNVEEILAVNYSAINDGAS